MTEIVGYLVSEHIENWQEYIGIGQINYFPPHGTFMAIAGFPSKDYGPDQREEFCGRFASLYTELCKKGLQNIRMAMTLLSNAFDEYELKYLEREASPASFDDWLALAELYDENERRDREFRERYESPPERTSIFRRREKAYLPEVRMTGVLAVARIRSDLENVVGG